MGATEDVEEGGVATAAANPEVAGVTNIRPGQEIGSAQNAKETIFHPEKPVIDAIRTAPAQTDRRTIRPEIQVHI